jgi:hypothetical protein
MHNEDENETSRCPPEQLLSHHDIALLLEASEANRNPPFALIKRLPMSNSGTPLRKDEEYNDEQPLPMESRPDIATAEQVVCAICVPFQDVSDVSVFPL